jgi:HEAT repeat protein
MRFLMWTLSALLLVEATSAQAGIFDRKSKPRPPAAPAAAALSEKEIERVLTLIDTVQSAKQSNKRADAAEALHEFDAQLFPEIVPSLVQAALRDPDSGVRREAVRSLGRIRPPSREAAQALEQAMKDESYRVRLQARTSKLGYKVPEFAPRVVPEAQQLIKVPPPSPDGRLTPVPVPSASTPAQVRESPALATPPAAAEPTHKQASVSLAKPQPKSRETNEPDGPILVPPKR